MSPDPSGRATAAPRASRTAVRIIEAPGLQTWAPDSRAFELGIRTIVWRCENGKTERASV